MDPTAACPPVDRLSQLMNGQLPAAEVDALAGHLEDCPQCLQTVQLVKDETVANDLRAAARVPDSTETAQVTGLVERLLRLRAESASEISSQVDDATQTQAPASATSTGDELKLFAPPQAAGELGRLNGYRVLRVLGQGGMGTVLLAEDIKLKRTVALKVMRPELAANEEHKQRFLREAQAAARVEHDHIVPIYQIGEENGVPYIAMPFLKGESLDDRLRRAPRLPLHEVIRIGREIALGLAAAHAHGLVHRDIKPGNVWLEEMRNTELGIRNEETASGIAFRNPNSAFRIRILDFGLARPAEDDTHITRSGAIVGTPAYMSPEQGRSEKVDHRTDLFSLGVILYQMTTGQRPFRGPTTMAILTSLAIDNPVPPRQVNAAVPEWLSALVMKLLAKDPVKRPTSAREVAKLLNPAPSVETLPPLATEAAVDPWADIDDATEPAISPSPQPSPPPGEREKARASSPLSPASGERAGVRGARLSGGG